MYDDKCTERARGGGKYIYLPPPPQMVAGISFITSFAIFMPASLLCTGHGISMEKAKGDSILELVP